MLILDDILLSPFRGIFWVFNEVHKAAQEELSNEEKAITAELGNLYVMLDKGGITEAEFEKRERELLDRLDEIAKPEAHVEDDEDEEEMEHEQSINTTTCK